MAEIAESGGFRLEYGEIDVGWLDVRVVLGGREVRTQASYLSEPLTEWIEAALKMARARENPIRSGAPETWEVDLIEEPACHRFTLCWPEKLWRGEVFHPTDPVRIAQAWRSDGGRSPATITHPAVAVPWVAMAVEICRASRELYRRYGMRRYFETWCAKEFAAGRLLQLHGLVYGDAVFARYRCEHDLLMATEIVLPGDVRG